MQSGEDGFFVSRLFGLIPLPMLKSPIEIGIKQLQQMSEIGLTNRPRQVKLPNAEIGIIIAIINIAICLFCAAR
jgi:hypothetical protein